MMVLRAGVTTLSIYTDGQCVILKIMIQAIAQIAMMCGGHANGIKYDKNSLAKMALCEELNNEIFTPPNVKLVEDILNDFDTVVRFVRSCYHDTVLWRYL